MPCNRGVTPPRHPTRLSDQHGGLAKGKHTRATTVAIQNERLAGAQNDVAHIPVLGDPDGALQGRDAETPAVVDAMHARGPEG